MSLEKTEKKPISERPLLIASFDVETDGCSVVLNNLLSVGICFIKQSGQVIGELEYNIAARPDRAPEPRCMTEFWAKNPRAWEYVHTNVVLAEWAMQDLSKRLTELAKTYEIKWGAWPCCFDWAFLKNYYEQFGPVNKYDIGYDCIDFGSEYKSIAKAMGRPLKEVTEPFKIVNAFQHSALSDARCQGIQYNNFCLWRRSLRKHLGNVNVEFK